MLNGPRWSNTLFSDLNAKGFRGSRLHEFTDAVGIGSGNHVIGKHFTTADIGLVPGIGAGVGTGIVGYTQDQVSNQIFSLAQSFGFMGSRLRDICDACGQAQVTELAQASLTSVDTPVFLGSGTIVVGSIGVVGSVWASQIQSIGTGENFIGSKWPDFCKAIGGGQAQPVVASGTGSLVISGSPTSTPSPGSGTGIGTIA